MNCVTSDTLRNYTGKWRWSYDQAAIILYVITSLGRWRDDKRSAVYDCCGAEICYRVCWL
jgi:hypothetical protein